MLSLILLSQFICYAEYYYIVFLPDYDILLLDYVTSTCLGYLGQHDTIFSSSLSSWTAEFLWNGYENRIGPNPSILGRSRGACWQHSLDGS
jgi:hypothetical protein